jgi:site-specific DNA recombinase
MIKKQHRKQFSVFYARVSSDGQEENTSLGMQKEKGISYAQTFDLTIVAHFYDVSSGGNADRPGYQSMIRFLSDNPTISMVIVWSLNRLHRSARNLLNCHAELEDKGVQLVSISERIDTTTLNGRLFFTMIAGFDEFERGRIGERVAAGKRQRIKGGFFTAGRPPFGYRVDDTGKLVVVERQAKTVKKIFLLRAKKNSLREIAQKVDDGTKMGYGKVGYILKNPAYKGDMRQENGMKIIIPRIISSRLWNKVNCLIND